MLGRAGGGLHAIVFENGHLGLREANPMQLSITKAHQWLVHGTSDDVVPPSFSRDYVALKQRRSGKEQEDAHLLEVPGADHFDLIDPRSKAWNSIEPIALDATA